MTIEDTFLQFFLKGEEHHILIIMSPFSVQTFILDLVTAKKI